ncbi:MAG: polysaccharide biosynthesis protein [Clostridia bacterium]|nr:polysaccharide biosynthesis protein [Clostridia bacterium]
MDEYNYNKSLFLKQGIILTSVSVFLRLTNIFYRSFLSSKLGSEGLGLYQLIFSVFTFAVTLSTSGISLAVTRLVTTVIADDNKGAVNKTVKGCLIFAVILSLSVAFILYILSDSLSLLLLGDIKLSFSLKILSLGLPFMAMCTILKGYFLAVDKGTVTGIADTLEQILTIALCTLFFNLFSLRSINSGLIWAMAASSLGETVSFIYNYISYKRSLKLYKNKPAKKLPKAFVRKGLFHIALPCTLSAAARSLLNTLENILIPIMLQSSGFQRNAALSSYGVLQGMAVPVLYFPASFLYSFAFLLIPKISFDREQNRKKHLSYLSEKALFTSLIFGCFFFALFFLLADEFGEVFYKNKEAGFYIRLLSPLTPLMYLDSVTDNLLKGMDKQFDSMKYNMLDSFLRVLMIITFMGKYGMKAYLFIVWFSTIFNAALSLNKLIKTGDIKLKSFYPILLILPFAFLCVMLPDFIFSLTGNKIDFTLLFTVKTLLSAALFSAGLLIARLKCRRHLCQA